ncbi:MAG: ankyrin repeat domain-containing protein [Melioribacteraceae bacterium]|nr:ankyrin repeat domain-containing protein [Melioribacteraceae bacterium]
MKKLLSVIIIALSISAITNIKAQEIFDAVKNNDLDKVKLLIEKEPDLVNARDPNEQSPLHYAVQKSNPDIIKLLVVRRAAVDIKNKMGLTPFYYAASSGKKDIINYLLAKGANKKDLELKNPWGRTPLCAVSRDGGNVETIKTLIDLGADINTKDNSGWSPIQLAAWRPYKDVVNILLEAGADLEISRDEGKRLFGNAVSFGLENLFEKMISLGFSIDINNSDTKALILSAAGGGSKKITEFLISKGFDLNYKNRYGWAPVHLAAEQGHKEIISLLLQNGADINIRNMLGQSAYNIAVERDDPELANFLKSLNAETSDPEFPVIEGKYLGQSPPGNTPAPFGLGIIFHRYHPHSTVAVSPDGDEIFWNPMINPRGGGYSYGYLMSTKLENGVWTYPKKVSFSEKEHRDDHPVFSYDGNKLFFASIRPVDKSNNKDNQKRIWYVEKEQNGWSGPKLFEEQPSPESASEMFFTFSFNREGNYYSMDGRDIFCARFQNGKYLPPEKLGNNINTGELIGAPYISPDGTFLLYYRGKPFVSFKRKDGSWSDGIEIEKSIGRSLNYSFSGDYIFMGYSWVSNKIIEELKPKE